LGAEGAVNILHRNQLAQAEYSEEIRAAFIKEFRDSFGSPYAAAASGHVDDVILPSETRPKLIAGLDYLREKQASLPPKKHGCMPV
jgi:propionyl-CoA carboxylase beta chain